ncbi:D-alanyl-D-alanine carboxypeptidase [Microbacterium sp. STN6]|uniref:D-alanyl-D-alanine carboxypeptidase/D-alanyl-D-alanine-endopeptidase n=1 Tax=Microbacterium sp. STN6 TaxID=2995588 RepID=UPI00226081E3|nr:D-alanyl-D-alanine carboxypeptidase [Microbacterium sp. STN6]MCX7520935.1 D-alanyl-D-alanine carboxypeptidase [Microbacterium sp. STN6]
MEQSEGPEASRAAGSAARGRRGILRSLRDHRQAWLIAAACVAFAVLGSGAVAVGAAVGAPAASATRAPGHSSSPSASAAPTHTPRPTPATASAAAPIRTCSVDALAQDARLGNLEAQVVNAKTGEVLFDRNGSKPNPTASVMKVVTSAAALAILGPNYRVSTTVVAGPDANSVILVGGGDSTLSRLPTGDEPFYRGAAHLDDLAKQTVANHPAPITTVYVDTSLFGAPYWQPTWNEHEERFVDGSSSYVTALQVDGDRADPHAMDSQRGDDPVTVAANAFVAALASEQGAAPAYKGESKAAAGAAQLAVVQSQPVSSLIKLAVTYSDNTIMEMLTRLVAIKTGSGNTFAAENAGVLKGLAAYGIDTTGVHVADGSGLSDQNAVPPSFLTQLFIKVLNGDKGLGVVYDGLPIAGKTGTLAPGYGRFTGASAVARGAVHAKTGSVDGGFSLAGIINAKDGTALTFAVYAFGNVNTSARAAIDALTAGFYTCGNNLSDN